MPKLFFFALIDCLGGKLLENYGVQFFRALDPILWALKEDHTLFVPFNINKAVLPDKNDTFALLYYFRSYLKV